MSSEFEYTLSVYKKYGEPLTLDDFAARVVELIALIRPYFHTSSKLAVVGSTRYVPLDQDADLHEVLLSQSGDYSDEKAYPRIASKENKHATKIYSQNGFSVSIVVFDDETEASVCDLSLIHI